MKKGFEFLLQSNFFIAFAAVCMTLQTQWVFDIGHGLHPYIFIVFFATLFEYNLHRLFTLIYSKEALTYPKHQWLRNNLKLFYVIMTISSIGFGIAVYFAKPRVIEGLAPLALLTLFYSVPFIRFKNRLFKLRDIPLIKTLLIALIWALSTVMLPVWQSGAEIPTHQLILTFTERFLFIFAITIPFDIRDMDTDQNSGLKTFPLLIGEQASWRLALFCMALSAGPILMNYWHSPWFLLAMMVSTAVGFWILRSESIRNLRHYHYGVLDGSMILQSLLAGVAYWLS